MAKKSKLDEEEVYYDNWSDYNDRDGKRYDRKKQEIEYARRLKSQEKDSFFSDQPLTMPFESVQHIKVVTQFINKSKG